MEAACEVQVQELAALSTELSGARQEALAAAAAADAALEAARRDAEAAAAAAEAARAAVDAQRKQAEKELNAFVGKSSKARPQCSVHLVILDCYCNFS